MAVLDQTISHHLSLQVPLGKCTTRMLKALNAGKVHLNTCLPSSSPDASQTLSLAPMLDLCLSRTVPYQVRTHHKVPLTTCHTTPPRTLSTHSLNKVTNLPRRSSYCIWVKMFLIRYQIHAVFTIFVFSLTGRTRHVRDNKVSEQLSSKSSNHNVRPGEDYVNSAHRLGNEVFAR